MLMPSSVSMVALTPLAPSAAAVHHGGVRLAALTGCTLAASVGLSLGTAGASAPHPDSGIHGLVLYGPTCPVQRPGHSCVRPFRAWITVAREPAKTVATRVRSGADGRFTARLAAGHYLLTPQNGKPFPRARSRTVTVSPHHFSAVTIHFDSGIR
jgi:hypothetical protein